MNKSYKDLYNSMITTKAIKYILKYNSERQKYIYRPYSHQPIENALDDISNLIIDDTIFYAFTKDEILAMEEDFHILEDLRNAAKYAFSERLPERKKANSDGIVGEILLDIFIQAYEKDSDKLVARAKHTEMNSKKEITGYDALYFTKNDDSINLWLGQAKAGSRQYCQGDIAKDLKTKYTKEYFSDTCYYIKDKGDCEELKDLLKRINRLCFDAQRYGYTSDLKYDKFLEILNEYNVVLKIPCLLAYTKDIYYCKEKLEELIKKEVSSISNYFEKNNFSIDLGLPYEILFYLMPIKDVSYIRQRISDVRKEVT